MTRSRRQRERGGAILLAMVVLTSLSILAGLTVVSVQGGMAQTRTQRFHAIAVYAAESGAAAAMVYLRNNLLPAADPNPAWKLMISPGNLAPLSPAAIPGNNVAPGAVGNLFSADMQAWYSVMILNNVNDSGFVAGFDNDATVKIYSTGYGPDGAVATVEWEISGDMTVAPAPAPYILLGWRQIL